MRNVVTNVVLEISEDSLAYLAAFRQNLWRSNVDEIKPKDSGHQYGVPHSQLAMKTVLHAAVFGLATVIKLSHL